MIIKIKNLKNNRKKILFLCIYHYFKSIIDTEKTGTVIRDYITEKKSLW